MASNRRDLKRQPVPNQRHACVVTLPINLRDAKHPLGNKGVPAPDPKHQTAIPDLHSNALKYINSLILRGILIISPEDYEVFFKLYYRHLQHQRESDRESKIAALTRDFKLFKQILRRVRVNPHSQLIIGDESQDRGVSDGFMFDWIEVVAESKDVDLQILISNHGIEAYEKFEKGDPFSASMLDATKINKPNFGISGNRLQNEIDLGIRSRTDVESFFKNVYQPSLRVLSYSLSKDKKKITLFAHAPFGFRVIKALAKKLCVVYRDESAQALAETIDDINDAFQEFVKHNKAHELYDPVTMEEGFLGYPINPDTHPFEFIMWNRRYGTDVLENGVYKETLDDILVRPFKKNGYYINYSHGHDSGDIGRKLTNDLDEQYIFSLDEETNDIGKNGGDPKDYPAPLHNVYLPPDIPQQQDSFKGKMEVLHTRGVSRVRPKPTPQVEPNEEFKNFNMDQFIEKKYEKAVEELQGTIASPDYDNMLQPLGQDILDKVKMQKAELDKAAGLDKETEIKIEDKQKNQNDKRILVEILQRTNLGIKEPSNSDNLIEFEKLTTRVVRKKSWPKIIGGCLLGFLGVAICIGSLALVGLTVGGSIPITLAGLKLGSSLIASALSVAIIPASLTVGAAAGAGLFAGGVILANQGKEKRKSTVEDKEIPKFAQIARERAKLRRS